MSNRQKGLAEAVGTLRLVFEGYGSAFHKALAVEGTLESRTKPNIEGE